MELNILIAKLEDMRKEHGGEIDVVVVQEQEWFDGITKDLVEGVYYGVDEDQGCEEIQIRI